MGMYFRRDFSLGWLPSADAIKAPKNSLLRMDNCVLDEIGAVALRQGSQKINEFALGSLIEITSACPTIPPEGVMVSIPYSFTPTVNGGVEPFTWTISAGALPNGLSIDSTTGEISGTPTTTGTFNFTIHVHSSDGQDTDNGSCQIIVVPYSFVARPLTEEFEDNPPVNPLRSRVLNGTLAADGDEATYAELQLDSCTSVLFGLASLLFYDFRPLPTSAPDHVVVHVITEYIPGNDGSAPFGATAATALFKQRNPNPVGAGGLIDGFIINIDLSGGNSSVAKAEYTHTISGADWVSVFGSDSDNIWVRSTQYDTGNWSLVAPMRYLIYECWIEYFF
jgi:hypothetical protein